MTAETRRRVGWAAVAGVVVVVLVLGFRSGPVPVRTGVVERGALQVVVEEEGETRPRERYVVAAPTAGWLHRVELEVGDGVEAGDILARLSPPRASLLDPRSRSEAAARLATAEASDAEAELAQARAGDERARVERLAASGSATRQALEEARAAEARARAAREAARAERSAARAALETIESAGAGGAASTLTSPTAGRLLVVHQRSEGPVSPGQPLFEIGDTGALEVVVRVLSRDAVRIEPGTRVLVTQWGGDRDLEARVSRVDPEGFSQVSALGVEERRVLVNADLMAPPGEQGGLGSGYRVVARFIVWEDEDVLLVPTAALFRTGEGWSTFVVEGGRAVAREVEVGRQSGLAAQVLSGLSAGDRVVVHPGNDLADGVRVRVENDP